MVSYRFYSFVHFEFSTLNSIHDRYLIPITGLCYNDVKNRYLDYLFNNDYNYENVLPHFDNNYLLLPLNIEIFIAVLRNIVTVKSIPYWKNHKIGYVPSRRLRFQTITPKYFFKQYLFLPFMITSIAGN